MLWIAVSLKIAFGQELPPPGDAEPLPELSQEQIDALKPRHAAMGILPRQKVDFTAYALEPGEARVGVSQISIGLMPRMHAGTSLLLDGLRLYNGHLKFNIIRLGNFDLAVQGSVYGLPIGEFYAQYSATALLASWIQSDHLSFHAGAERALLEFRGIPDLGEVSPLLIALAGEDPDTWEMDPEGLLHGINPRFQGNAVWVNGAVEWRLNRRDSLIARGSAVVHAEARAQVNVDWEQLNLPPIAGLDQAFSATGAGVAAESWAAALAYQASWKQVDLRVGLGYSAVPWAWVLKSVDLSYRFGGETRQHERRALQGWRRSKERDLPPAK